MDHLLTDENGNFTLFAPDNNAFDSMDSNRIERLVNNKPELRRVSEYTEAYRIQNKFLDFNINFHAIVIDFSQQPIFAVPQLGRPKRLYNETLL